MHSVVLIMQQNWDQLVIREALYEGHLRNHLESKHNKSFKLSCSCGKLFPDSTRLNRHKKTVNKLYCLHDHSFIATTQFSSVQFSLNWLSIYKVISKLLIGRDPG